MAQVNMQTFLALQGQQVVDDGALRWPSQGPHTGCSQTGAEDSLKDVLVGMNVCYIRPVPILSGPLAEIFLFVNEPSLGFPTLRLHSAKPCKDRGKGGSNTDSGRQFNCEKKVKARKSPSRFGWGDHEYRVDMSLPSRMPAL